MKSFLKFIFVYISQAIMHIFHFIPLKNDRLTFSSYEGDQYSCNPKYISEYLQKNYPNKFEIIWLFKHPEEYAYLSKQGIKPIQRNYFNRMRYGLTSKVNIVNVNAPFTWIPPRKNQLNIDTWHGGGRYKLVGINEKRKSNFTKRYYVIGSNNTSYLLSTNKCFTDEEIRKDFNYHGDVLNIGFPRNDCFFNGDRENIREKVCNYFAISTDVKIIMYAPTFRYKTNINYTCPNFECIKEAAHNRFGGNWIVLTRAHYWASINVENQNVYDATYKPDMPDMQELLMASDMLISDYSSCIWDFSFTGRPCLLYTPDLDEYTENRGFGIDIYEWGFPVCKTEQELLDTIENFDLESFQKAMQKHHDDLGSFEDGHATEKVCKLIYDHCFGSEEDKNQECAQ